MKRRVVVYSSYLAGVKPRRAESTPVDLEPLQHARRWRRSSTSTSRTSSRLQRTNSSPSSGKSRPPSACPSALILGAHRRSFRAPGARWLRTTYSRPLHSLWQSWTASWLKRMRRAVFRISANLGHPSRRCEYCGLQALLVRLSSRTLAGAVRLTRKFRMDLTYILHTSQQPLKLGTARFSGCPKVNPAPTRVTFCKDYTDASACQLSLSHIPQLLLFYLSLPSSLSSLSSLHLRHFQHRWGPPTSTASEPHARLHMFSPIWSLRYESNPTGCFTSVR